MTVARKVTPAGLTSVGFQKITLNSTATGLNSTAGGGSVLMVSVETQSVRMTFDGSTPAVSTGVLLTAANSPYIFDGVPVASVKFARAASGAIINAQTFRRS